MMHSKHRAIVLCVLMLTILSGLFGCGEKYTVDDIVGVSLFESGMDRNAAYAYGLIREGDAWYLSAECGNVGRYAHFDCMYFPVEANTILDSIKEGEYIKKTRSKKRFAVFAPDTPGRELMLTFSDDTKQSAAIPAPELRKAFAALSAAIEAGIPMYAAEEATGLYLSANGMNADESYSFALFQDDGWRLSADCLSGDARVTLDEVRITDEDAGTLLAIAFDEELDKKVFTYRALPDDLVVQDEDVHLVSMHFGKTAGQAHIESEALEEGFFALVRKYTGNNLSKEE